MPDKDKKVKVVEKFSIKNTIRKLRQMLQGIKRRLRGEKGEQVMTKREINIRKQLKDAGLEN